MKKIKLVFWNDEQCRMRAGFRVALQLILFIALGEALGSLRGLIAPGIKLSSEAPLWFFIVFAGSTLASAFISVWLAGRFLDRRRLADFGLSLHKDWWLNFGFGMLLGAFLITGVFITEYLLGWVTVTEILYALDPDLLFVLPLSVVMTVFVCVGVAEELVTRGYLLTNLSEGLNLRRIGPQRAIVIAWLLSSVIFGLFHLDNPNATLVSTFNIILGGVLLGLGYVLTGELAIPIGLHITWNFFQGSVFGFPVSGITMPAKVVTIVQVEQSGPEAWTGGAFGPEGGLIGVGAMLTGLFLTLAWVRYRQSGIALHTPVAEYTKTTTVHE